MVIPPAAVPGRFQITTRCAGTRPTGCSARSSSNAGRPQRRSPHEDSHASWRCAAQVTAPPLQRPGSLRDGLRPPLTPEPLRHLTDQHHGQARRPAPGARGAPFRSQDHINQKSLRFQGMPTRSLESGVVGHAEHGRSPVARIRFHRKVQGASRKRYARGTTKVID